MEGAAAATIRDAEAALAGQQSVAAQIDLQVVIAVLNAHTDHGRSIEALEQLQQDVENAVASRPDLGTGAGARSFQRYLIGKMRDIRTVIEAADLDATSKAALAAALSSLYASSATPDEPTVPHEPFGPDEIELPAEEPDLIPAETIPSQGAVAPPVAAPPAAAPIQPPAWGGSAPASGGFPPLSAPSLPEVRTGSDTGADPLQDPQKDEPAETATDEVDTSADSETADLNTADVVLPNGETVTAPSPELADVITAAVAGTPIAEAFSRQGITVPAPGSPVAEPIDPADVLAGDIGVFTDRHALSLGNGTALLDDEIAPVAAIGGTGFLGWQHPPKPEPAARPAATTTP